MAEHPETAKATGKLAANAAGYGALMGAHVEATVGAAKARPSRDLACTRHAPPDAASKGFAIF
jgi:hypothetical protein